MNSSRFVVLVLVLFVSSCTAPPSTQKHCESYKDCPQAHICVEEVCSKAPHDDLVRRFTDTPCKDKGCPSTCKLVFEKEVDIGQVMPNESKVITWQVKHRLREQCVLSHFEVKDSEGKPTQDITVLESTPLPAVLGLNETYKFKFIYKPTKPRQMKTKLFLFDTKNKEPVANVDIIGFSNVRCGLKPIIPLHFDQQVMNCATIGRLVLFEVLEEASCSAQVSIKKISIQGPGKDNFMLQSTFATLPKVTKDNPAHLHVQFRPQTPGQHSATLVVETNATKDSVLNIPLSGTGATNQQTLIDTFEMPDKDAIDILFIIEQSERMRPFMAEVKKQLEAYTRWLESQGKNIHAGVTTTDTTGRYHKKGCLIGPVYSNQVSSTVAKLTKQFATNPSGNMVNRGLDSALQTITKAKLDKEPCVKGFYRENASLSLIFISSHDDQSEMSVQHYINQFRKIKKKSFRANDLIRASAFTALHHSGCKQDTKRSNLPSVRYNEFSSALRGIVGDVCDENWAASLTGGNFRSYLNNWWLSQIPDPKTIKMRVNGRDVQKSPSYGWTYHSDSNSLTCAKAAQPPDGSRIEVEYRPLCF